MKSFDAKVLRLSKEVMKLLPKEVTTWTGSDYSSFKFIISVKLAELLPQLQADSASAEAKALAGFIDLCERTPFSPLRKGFRDLLSQTISNDMVLQIIPFPSFDALEKYTTDFERTSGFQIRCLAQLVPALGSIVHASSPTNPPPPELLSYLSVLLKRFRAILAKLIENYRAVKVADAEPVVVEAEAEVEIKSGAVEDEGEWRKTGSVNGGPKIRNRAKYPRMQKEGGMERVIESETCRKYYQSYAKSSGMIGGFWCPHGMCVGFHFMPTAEGRNDMFAGIYTHWKVAPQVVIYDYACQLAAYCMVREPEYWKKTSFLVDELHARGHSNCSPAAFLAPSMAQDPILRQVNGSAAECARGTVGRIQKSLSYMNEEHGIQQMWVMIQVWNGRKLKAMAARKAKGEVFGDLEMLKLD